jgi:rhodanese-related sulfurtransferase
MNITSSLQPGVTNISPLELSRLLERSQLELPLLIDVRSHIEYLTGHAPNAVNLSLPRLLLSEGHWLRNWLLPRWFRELPKDTPIAVICLTAHRSPIAAQRLAKEGFTQVFNITGGLVEWQRIGLEIVR